MPMSIVTQSHLLVLHRLLYEGDDGGSVVRYGPPPTPVGWDVWMFGHTRPTVTKGRLHS